MNFPVQPLLLTPLPGGLETRGFATPALQKALSHQPSLAVGAAGQAFQLGSLHPAGVLPTPSTAGLEALSSQGHTDQKLRQVSKDFEAIFMRMIFQQMRQSVHRSDVMGNSRAMEFFETMRDEQLAESLASAGGLGIGDLIYERLKEASIPHQKTFE